MKFNGKAVMLLCLMGISLWTIISALQWPIKTGIFPIGMGGIVFLLAMVELFFTLFQKDTDTQEKKEETEVMDFKLSADTDRAVARQRTVSIFLWIVGFFFMIVLLGMPVALPLFMFLCLKFSGKEGWKTSIGLTAVVWVSFYFLFIWFLKTQFLAGWIQQWVKGFIS
jgi:hypothetical protein